MIDVKGLYKSFDGKTVLSDKPDYRSERLR